MFIPISNMAKKATPAIEDYLETIYKLTQSKGYAKVVDISEKLNVRPPTVTSMVQKLGERGLLEYEKYREVSLTQKGEEIAIDNYHFVIEEATNKKIELVKLTIKE